MVSRLIGMLRRHGMDGDCREVRERSSDFVDGDVNEPSEQRIRIHIGRCGPCNSFINTLKATVNLLRSTPKKEPSEGFRARVLENIQKNRNS